MSNFKTSWQFVAQDGIGPVLQGIGGKVNALDAHVAKHNSAFKSAMASNRASAFSFGDGMEQVAGRLNPMLGGMVSEIRRLGTSLFDVKPSAGMAPLQGGLANLAKGGTEAKGGIGGVVGMLANLPPQAAAAAAALAVITAGFVATTAEAASFEHKYRELSNLNLDKTTAQVGQLRDSVLDAAFDKGINASAMSKGFFDFQSITGKYGDEVDRTGRKVADFSKSYIVDFNKQLEGTGQAMKSFGFGGDQVDRFLASTVKTVQTGKTTFEQLSQVRSEYFDSAAGAGFDFEGADKLFAAYSLGAKSVDVAATQVKETFRGLSDGKVIAGLKAQGVNVFDPLTHKIRTMDQIAAGMVKTFATARMSDEAFAKIKSDIGGGDGIAMLLNKARAQGQGFLQVFKDFDGTTVDMKAALAGANRDLYTMWDTAKAKFGVALIRIGTQVLPHVVDGLKVGLDVMNALAGRSEGIGKGIVATVWAFKALGGVVMNQFNGLKMVIEAAIQPIWDMVQATKWIIGAGSDLNSGMNDAISGRDREAEARAARISKMRQDGSKALGERVQSMSGSDAYRSGNAEAVLGKILADTKGTPEGAQYNAALKMGGGDGRATILRGIKDAMNAKPATFGGASSGMPGYIADVVAEGGGKSKGGGSLGDLTSGGSGQMTGGGGGQVRNITVNIQQLVGAVNIHAATVRESAANITSEVERAMMAAIRNAEIAM